jgi:hypothetical protein
MSAPPPETPAPAGGVEMLAAPDGEAASDGASDAAGDPFAAGWSSVRDANIRPYADWRPAQTVSLPVLQVRPQQQQHHHNGHHQQHGRPSQNGHQQGQHGRHGGKGYASGKGFSGGNERGGRRNKRRGRDNERGGNNRMHRDRGPRLPGFYNPGGD